jgi:hypothetical protein
MFALMADQVIVRSNCQKNGNRHGCNKTFALIQKETKLPVIKQNKTKLKQWTLK